MSINFYTFIICVILCDSMSPAIAQNEAIQPYFIKHSTFDTVKVLKKMGVTLERFQTLNDEVCTAVYWDRTLKEIDNNSRLTPAEKLQALSSRVRKIVDAYCIRQALDTKPRILKQWLFAKACCAYVVADLDYDWDLVRQPNQERKARSTSASILLQAAGSRKAICIGFAILPRDMVRSGGSDLGIKTNFVGSFSRDLGKDATEFSNHAFVCFEMDEGVIVPAELTTPRMKLKDYQTRCTAPREEFVMPFTPEARELFLGRNYGADETLEGDVNMGDKQNLYKLCDLSLSK